jgi:hypothetical protein
VPGDPVLYSNSSYGLFNGAGVDFAGAGVLAGFGAGVETGFGAGVDTGFGLGVETGLGEGVETGRGVETGFGSGLFVVVVPEDEPGFEVGSDSTGRFTLHGFFSGSTAGSYGFGSFLGVTVVPEPLPSRTVGSTEVGSVVPVTIGCAVPP